MENGIAADFALLVPKHSLSTSSRLGLGKEENYAYDLYEVEFLLEVLFGVPYRRSLTTIFPRFLKVMARYHETDICCYFADVFGFQGPVEDSVEKWSPCLKKSAFRCILRVKSLGRCVRKFRSILC